MTNAPKLLRSELFKRFKLFTDGTGLVGTGRAGAAVYTVFQ